MAPEHAAELAAITLDIAETYEAWDGPPAFYSISWDDKARVAQRDCVYLLAGLPTLSPDLLPHAIAVVGMDILAKCRPGDNELIAFGFLFEAITIAESTPRTQELWEHLRDGRLREHPAAVEVCIALTVDTDGYAWLTTRTRETGELDVRYMDPGERADFRGQPLEVFQAVESCARLLPLSRWMAAPDPDTPPDEVARRIDGLTAALADFIEDPDTAHANLAAFLADGFP